MDEIKFKDFWDMISEQIDKANWYWNFYAVTVIALLGWLISEKTSIDSQQKLFLITVFAVFAFMNFLALYRTHKVLEIIVEELKIKMAENKFDLSQKTKDYVHKFSGKIFIYTDIIVHLVSDPLIILFLWKCS